MKLYYILLLFLAVFVGSAGAVVIDPDVTLQTGNTNVHFGSAVNQTGVAVTDNGLGFQTGDNWQNMSIDSNGATDMTINSFGAYYQDVDVTADAGTTSNYTVDGYYPKTNKLVNGVTSPITDGTAIFSITGSGKYRAYYSGYSSGTGRQIVHGVKGQPTLIPVQLPVDAVGAIWTEDGKLIENPNTSYVTGETIYYIPITAASTYMITAIPVFADASQGQPIPILIMIDRPLANDSNKIPPLNSSNFNKTVDDMLTFNVTGSMEDVSGVFVPLFGVTFYAIIFALPFLFLWINTRKLTMPTVIFLLFGWLVIGLVPAEYHYIIWIAVAISFAMPFVLLIYKNRME